MSAMEIKIPKKFKLKNYTTKISAVKTIAEIEEMLSCFGASRIMKEISNDGRTTSIAFLIGDQGYKLPANIEGVKQVLYGCTRDSYGRNNMRERHERSYRVAWRIIRDWLHAQLSIIASGQATPDQIMLPYLFDGNRTLYDIYKAGGLKQLTGPKED
jgi:hypothetical protein